MRRRNETIEVPISGRGHRRHVGQRRVPLEGRLYRAERRVKVPAVSRQLQVSLDRRAGGVEAARARDVPAEGRPMRAGAPVRGQFSLAVVDEAVYGVKADDTPDPLRFFYQRSYSRVGTQFSREYYFVGYSGHQQLMLRDAPPAVTRSPTSRPTSPRSRRSARSSPTRSTGSATWSPTRRARRACRSPTRMR